VTVRHLGRLLDGCDNDVGIGAMAEVTKLAETVRQWANSADPATTE
jgi:hypothetical protein